VALPLELDVDAWRSMCMVPGVDDWNVSPLIVTVVWLELVFWLDVDIVVWYGVGSGDGNGSAWARPVNSIVVVSCLTDEPFQTSSAAIWCEGRAVRLGVRDG